MIRELVASFDRTLAFIGELVADVPDEELVLQPPGLVNHAAWTLGHVVHSWQAMAEELGVPRWLPDDWEFFFGYGSAPDRVVGSGHASRTALLAALADAGGRLRAALLAVEESRLGEALPDEEARETFPTVGHALVQVVCAHTAYHAGQLAVWRRAIGRTPVGVFV